MTTVVLDSEALSTLALERPVERLRIVRSILAEAERRGGEAVVPAAVLVELYRGNATDAGLDRVLNGRGIRVVPVDRGLARSAGGLRQRDRLDSCHTVDCLVVATAIVLDAIIVTGDEADMRRLSRSHAKVIVHGVSPDDQTANP